MTAPDATTARALWRRGQRGWPARYPVAQFPNAPLLIALGAGLLARPLDGAGHDIARIVSVAALVAWALLELVRGDNAFRRVLGGGVLAYLAVRGATGR